MTKAPTYIPVLYDQPVVPVRPSCLSFSPSDRSARISHYEARGYYLSPCGNYLIFRENTFE